MNIICGSKDTYITFFFYDEENEESSEDDSEIEGYYLQIDIWSKSDYKDLVNQVKSALENADFIYTNSQDLYEDNTQIYHKALRFFKAKYLK